MRDRARHRSSMSVQQQCSYACMYVYVCLGVCDVCVAQNIPNGQSYVQCNVIFSSRRRHTTYIGDWSSDVCSSDLCDPPRGLPTLERPKGGRSRERATK